MPPFSALDAPVFVKDGVMFVTAVGSAKVHLDFPEEVEDFGSVSRPGIVAGHPRVTYVTADLPNLAHGTEGEIEGVAYKVRWTRQLDDGVLSVAELQKK